MLVLFQIAACRANQDYNGGNYDFRNTRSPAAARRHTNGQADAILAAQLIGNHPDSGAGDPFVFCHRQRCSAGASGKRQYGTHADYGDIIVFHNPGNPAEDFIKRVIGLPGDMVTVENGIVYINDFPLDESYIAAPPNYSGSWEVPEGGVFVLGDNRNQSSDSHAWGFVPVENIVGRALVIYWPLDSVQILNEPLVVNAAQ
jgi:signal peptidase I